MQNLERLNASTPVGFVQDGGLLAGRALLAKSLDAVLIIGAPQA